jgi:hypothetical protein
MQGWKSFGVFLTGFAAVVTAATALLTYIIESGLLISNVEPVKQKEEQMVKVQQFATIKDQTGG